VAANRLDGAAGGLKARLVASEEARKRRREIAT